MPKRIPVNLPSKQFATKKQAREFFTEMLHRYEDEMIVNEADYKFLIELLSLHPEANEKIGIGVRRFYRRISEEGTPCFYLERTDGTNDDFSFHWIIDSI